MLRLGIIGCGRVTTMFHLKAIDQLDSISVAAVSDVSDSRMQKAQGQCKAEKTYADYKDLLKDPMVDAVAINTPPRFHEEMVLDSLAYGKHVLCEKSLSQTVDGCLKIKEAQKESGLVVLPAHNYAFTPSLVHLEELVMKGEIGKVERMQVYFENYLKSYRSKTDFRVKTQNGIIEDVLPHIISVSSRIAGNAVDVREMNWQCKEYDVCDNIQATLLTEKDLELECRLSWTRMRPRFSVGVYGSEGHLSTDLMIKPYTVTLEKQGKKKKLKEKGLRWYLDLMRFKHPSFRGQYRHFERIIQGIEKPRITVDDEVAMLRIMEKMYLGLIEVA
ncbi:MAG: Gfo/Idh/MocA family oxidoreductase [Candidatus Bathyarchaeota archaeon]|nr:Gfo/Idh/MocA family oxidoreductase [Candidatus Bathyarchaeota archaeon]